jgi:hypothetical protein
VPGVVRHVFCENAARGMYERWHELMRSPTADGAERARTVRAARHDGEPHPVSR